MGLLLIPLNLALNIALFVAIDIEMVSVPVQFLQSLLRTNASQNPVRNNPCLQKSESDESKRYLPILEQRMSASSIECVVIIMALFPLNLIRISRRLFLFTGSSPVVGSSKNITSGSPTKEMATESLLFIPPSEKLLPIYFEK